MTTFPEHVRRARVAAGQTQQQTAERAGIEQSAVSLAETWGVGGSTPRQVLALGRALDLPEPVQTLGLADRPPRGLRRATLDRCEQTS